MVQLINFDQCTADFNPYTNTKNDEFFQQWFQEEGTQRSQFFNNTKEEVKSAIKLCMADNYQDVVEMGNNFFTFTRSRL